MKRRAQRIESPKPEPLLVATQKLARQARKFRSRASVLPAGWRCGVLSVVGSEGPSPRTPIPRQMGRARKGGPCLPQILILTGETHLFGRHLKLRQRFCSGTWGGRRRGAKNGLSLGGWRTSSKYYRRSNLGNSW